MAPPRYFHPADEAELFQRGATSWRMDIGTWRKMKGLLEQVAWSRPDGMPEDLPGHIPDKPLGKSDEATLEALRSSFDVMLNDPVLFPGLRQLGLLSTNGIEIQNGSFDDRWHHDGLAGKRMGHAGDFFAIAYFGEPRWEETWGGYFEYGARELASGWPSSGFEPSGETRKILPAERTVLLGWNQNPRLVHRAAPLRAARDRITLIASVTLMAR